MNAGMRVIYRVDTDEYVVVQDTEAGEEVVHVFESSEVCQ